MTIDLPEQLMITFILCMSILLFGLFVFDKMSKDISEKL